MEQRDSAFVQSMQKKKKQRRIRNLIILGVVLIALGVGIFYLFNKLNAPDEIVSQKTYTAARVALGEVSTTLSGSGTLTAADSATVTAPDKATVEKIYFQTGDALTKGDIVMELSSTAVKEDLEDLKSDLYDVQEELADTSRTRSSLSITAEKKGVVKDIQVDVGDNCDDADYLCLISTDGMMRVDIPATSGMRVYDDVTVEIGDETEDGYIYSIEDDVAAVVIDSDEYDYGAAATVRSDSGEVIGTGPLTVNDHVKVTVEAGRIATVNVKENQSVSRGRTLFKLVSGAPNPTYLELKEKEQDLLSDIVDMEDSLTIKAEWDGILSTLSVEEGDDVTEGAALCVLSGAGGYSMTLSIDELDIGSVRHGQDVEVTLDALDGTYSGNVTNISFAGTGTYVTSYSATVTTEPIEGAYPGMSATAEIITETSGETTIVSASAVQYDGDAAYLLKAADGVEAGTTLTEDELDVDSLEKIYVTTGMTNGSYIVAEGEGLSSGDVIWVPTMVTNAEYEEDEDTSVTFAMGGMPGGSMGTMPSGERPSGGYGGNRPSGSTGGYGGPMG